MNCTLCKQKIGLTFLGKILGTYVKDKNGKKQVVCPSCQAKTDLKDLK